MHQHISRATLATTSDWHPFSSELCQLLVCCIHLISCTHSLYTEALHYNHHLLLMVPKTQHEKPPLHWRCSISGVSNQNELYWTELLFFICTIVLQL